MSTPRTLRVPDEVVPRLLRTPRGEFAVHESRPDGPERGHVLLVPGFTGSKEDFTPVLPLLAARGWHATAYDQRGQFESPGAVDADYSLDGFAADARAVREQTAGVRTSHLVGHSFGGLVAQTALLAEPAAWASVTLLCTGPAGFDVEHQRKPLAIFARAVPQHGLDVVFERMQARRDPVPPEVLAFLRSRFVRSSPDSLVRIAGHLVEAPDRIDAVRASGVPVQVVRGRGDDEWSPAIQADMARRLGVEVQIVPDSAHSPAVENPAATADLFDDLFGGSA